MKIIGWIILGVFAAGLLVAGCFALINDEDSMAPVQVQLINHERSRCYEDEGCYEGDRGDYSGDQDYDQWNSDQRNHNRRNRGSFSPGPFDDSPVTIWFCPQPNSCNNGDSESGGDGRMSPDARTVQMKRPNGSLLALCNEAAAALSDDCIEVGWAGRPQVVLDGRRMNAAKAVWIIAHGDPGGLSVLHSCDNAQCINLRHLHLGTQADNMAEMRERGRQDLTTRRRGEARSNAKLTAEAVVAIRNSSEGAAALARQFGVAKKTIQQVRQGERWKSVSCLVPVPWHCDPKPEGTS